MCTFSIQVNNKTETNIYWITAQYDLRTLYNDIFIVPYYDAMYAFMACDLLDLMTKTIQ